MKEIENESYTYFLDEDSSAIFENIKFRNCSFENCYLSQNTNPFYRTTIRNIDIIDCTAKNCNTGTAIIENVTVKNLKTRGLIKVSGSVFNEVVLRGEIGQLMINNKVSSKYNDEEAHAFQKENEKFYSDVDCALDISEAEFIECDIRGIPSELIKRDPETQKVVTKRRAKKINFDNLDLNRRYFKVVIQNMLKFDYEDTVLVAPKQAKDFQELFSDLQQLEKLGITESN